MIRAGIDIGTNTILLLVAEVEGGKVTRVLEDHVRVVRLGQGVDKNRVFAPEAMERARACFRDYAEILKKYPGIPLRAAATSGSRDARNSAEFFSEIERTNGIKIEVISGEEEAETSFRGSAPEGVDREKITVLDIGGGSTEIVGFDKGEMFRVSFNIGCVRLTERFLAHDPPWEEEMLDLEDLVEGMFKKYETLFGKVRGKRMIAVAGTPTYLSSANLGLKQFDPEKIHGSKLTKADLDALIENLGRLPASERLGLGGMDKGRADVILAGALILRQVLKYADLPHVDVSVRGLRYGLALPK